MTKSDFKPQLKQKQKQGEEKGEQKIQRSVACHDFQGAHFNDEWILLLHEFRCLCAHFFSPLLSPSLNSLSFPNSTWFVANLIQSKLRERKNMDKVLCAQLEPRRKTSLFAKFSTNHLKFHFFLFIYSKDLQFGYLVVMWIEPWILIWMMRWQNKNKIITHNIAKWA